MSMKLRTDLFKTIEHIVTFDEELAPYTSMGIGGRAAVIARARDESEIQQVLEITHKAGVQCSILGNGTNLLINDEGTLERVVMFLNGEIFKGIAISGTRLVAGASVMLTAVVRESTTAGLAGMECLAGIPGSVGGALVMNAGGKYGNIGEYVESVVIIDSAGVRKTLSKNEITFDYRKTSLAHCVVIGVEFALKEGKKEEIQARKVRILEEKAATQPLKSKSAGCIFKNPPGDSAGRLIEKAGLKGFRIGDAQVSPLHANYIVNIGKAHFADVVKLIKEIQQAVERKFKILLELEVEIWE